MLGKTNLLTDVVNNGDRVLKLLLLFNIYQRLVRQYSTNTVPI